MTSLTALATSSDLNADEYTAANGVDAYIKLVTAYALLVGAFSVLFAVLGVGKLAEKIPGPCMKGFSWGSAMLILGAQLPDVLFAAGKSYVKKATASIFTWGAPFDGAKSAARMVWGLTHPLEWGHHTFVFTFLAVLFLKKGKAYLPKFLPKGFEVILVTVVSTAVSSYIGYTGKVVGQIPAIEGGLSVFGLFTLPIEFSVDFPWAEMPALLIPAALCAVVNFTATLMICGGFKDDDGLEWTPTTGLLAQGVGNLAAAVTGSAATGGSLSRSTVTKLTGATSRLAGAVTGLTFVLALPYASVLSTTPSCVLSAIVVAGVYEKVLFPTKLLDLKGTDAIVGWATGLMTAMCSPTLGISSGVAVAAVVHFYAQAQDKSKKKKA